MAAYTEERDPADRAVFGFYPQMAGRTKYAGPMNTGTQMTGPAGMVEPAVPVAQSAQQGLPRGVTPSNAGAGRGTVNPAGFATPSQPPVEYEGQGGFQPTTATAAPGLVATAAPTVPVVKSFGNVGFDPGFDGRGAVSPQNAAAAASLDAASRADTAGVLAKEQQAKEAAAAQASVAPEIARARAQEASIAAEQQARGFAPTYKGVAQDEVARLQTQQSEGAQQRATQEAIAAGGQQVQREATAASSNAQAARLGFDQQNAAGTQAQTAAHTEQIKQQTLAAQELTAARTSYALALQSKDPAKIADAEARLRGVQGKWEKDNATKFSVVPGGTVLDPASGQPIHQPSMVFNQETGEFKTAPQQQGNAAPAKAVGITEADYAKLPNGASYVGKDGKTYIKRDAPKG